MNTGYFTSFTVFLAITNAQVGTSQSLSYLLGAVALLAVT
jgi:hypothetical protein